ncbi:tyrosine 2,3-aminomutase [Lentzea sp.]|uniref:tyrosine 2,3-aminomutase n=1 Tax=Lentzea sp. TaxID=56099 RepID=UPI002CF73BE1|nr:tyrosine 2,3-aminomutase [Lentzea sp.]HUQ60615.1 tyrosine 2,3-aminomutase [Lentzea sp.]
MLIRGEGLTIDDVALVARQEALVEFDEDQMTKVELTRERVQKWGADGQPIYGVNTGFGEMVFMNVPPRFETDLQENLLRSHAAGGGEPFTDEAVRAMQVARLNCLVKGHSGIGADALCLMRELLNRGIHPVVPQQGSLGASGDLAPLAHLALPLIAAGRVRKGATVRQSAEVLAEEGLAPVRMSYKSGLALINGTSAMTGVSALALVRARRLLRLALWASATFIQVMRGSTGAFSEHGHALKNHRGQSEVAAVITRLLAGSALTREHAEIMALVSAKADGEEVAPVDDYLQNAYTLRCVPQILGPVLDTMAYCRRLVEEELNSCNDNPLIFDTPETVFHGGHFHGQYMAMASDFLNIALTEIGVLAERQLNRVLDPHLNKGFPAFLALGDEGLYSGLQGSQYLATSIASENLDLAAPSSVKSIPSNGQNQDVVSMGLIAARKSLRLTDNVNIIVCVLVAACYQAATITGIERFSPSVRGLLELLATKVPGYRDDVGVASDFLAEVRNTVLADEADALLPALDIPADPV